MEPSTVEKLEALRLHVQTLNDSLEDLRLQYDLCERRGERGRLQKEIEHLVTVLDPLTCDLLAMEEATSRQELQSEKEEYQVCVREEEVAFGEIQEEWVGSFVKDEQGEVYRVTFSGDIADYLEKQRMMYDPLRWSSVDGRTRCFKKKNGASWNFWSLWEQRKLSQRGFASKGQSLRFGLVNSSRKTERFSRSFRAFTAPTLGVLQK